MLTRCPQCETIFRVSKKHISAAKGLVRCGSCKDIFNAKEHVIKSKKDLKKPTAASKPETPITKPAQVIENNVVERKSAINSESSNNEIDGFDFVKDGFTSTGAFRKFDSATTTPTPQAPQNKKPLSKEEALARGKPTNFNFDSVFEDDAPKVQTKDEFITKKPPTQKKTETRPKIDTANKSDSNQAKFKTKTLQPHQATVVTPKVEDKPHKSGNFISQNVIEIKNVFNSISKKITNKVSKKIHQEKQSDEVIKKSLENKLNKSKVASQSSSTITETKISTATPVNKAPKKPAVMSITSETDIFSTSTKNAPKKSATKKINTPTASKPKIVNDDELTQKTSEPKIKAKPKLKEDAALKLAIQLKKAAQEKNQSTINKKPEDKSLDANKPVSNEKTIPNIIKSEQTIKPELNIIDSPAVKKPEPEKSDNKVSAKSETEPKLQLVETENLKKPEDKPADKLKEKSEDKKDSELIAKEGSDANEEDEQELDGDNVHIHMQTTDIPMVLRESLEELDLPSRSAEMTIFMIASLLLLCAGLFLQVAVFRSIEVQQSYPALKPIITKLCKTFTCNYTGPREIKKIQLISRDIRVHPNTKGALLISATIINNANYQQPYPNFSVKLSNLSGKTTAVRFFTPSDYLGKLSNKLLLMPPKQPIRIALEVVDPGKDAINFEFKFISSK